MKINKVLLIQQVEENKVRYIFELADMPRFVSITVILIWKSTLVDIPLTVSTLTLCTCTIFHCLTVSFLYIMFKIITLCC